MFTAATCRATLSDGSWCSEDGVCSSGRCETRLTGRKCYTLLEGSVVNTTTALPASARGGGMVCQTVLVAVGNRSYPACNDNGRLSFSLYFIYGLFCELVRKMLLCTIWCLPFARGAVAIFSFSSRSFYKKQCLHRLVTSIHKQLRNYSLGSTYLQLQYILCRIVYVIRNLNLHRIVRPTRSANRL